LIAGEEPELCLRLRESGWKIWRLDAEMATHDADMTHFGQWWIRAARGGYAMADVSWLHMTSRFNTWRRAIIRTIFWAALLPLFVILLSVQYPTAIVALLLYPLQIFRIAFRRGATSAEAWIYASFVMLAMFAELQGIMKFCWVRGLGYAPRIIEYRQTGAGR
jgi:GT2 family glycosyltransferase